MLVRGSHDGLLVMSLCSSNTDSLLACAVTAHACKFMSIARTYMHAWLNVRKLARSACLLGMAIRQLDTDEAQRLLMLLCFTSRTPCCTFALPATQNAACQTCPSSCAICRRWSFWPPASSCARLAPVVVAGASRVDVSAACLRLRRSSRRRPPQLCADEAWFWLPGRLLVRAAAHVHASGK